MKNCATCTLIKKCATCGRQLCWIDPDGNCHLIQRVSPDGIKEYCMVCSLIFGGGDTLNVTTFNVNGSPGKLISINSLSTSIHTLVKQGGGTINCSYLNIQHSRAQPANTWYATDSINNQAVATAGSGWTFLSSANGNFFSLL